MPSEVRAVRVRVLGRVQGVGFRYWTRERAAALGLAGWVRNDPDGSVAALVAGPPGRVTALVRALHEGPHGAEVAEVSVRPAEDAPAPCGFEILR
jgi:acylphosphatase